MFFFILTIFSTQHFKVIKETPSTKLKFHTMFTDCLCKCPSNTVIMGSCFDLIEVKRKNECIQQDAKFYFNEKSEIMFDLGPFKYSIIPFKIIYVHVYIIKYNFVLVGYFDDNMTLLLKEVELPQLSSI